MVGFTDYTEVHNMFIFTDFRLLFMFAATIGITMIGFGILARNAKIPKNRSTKVPSQEASCSEPAGPSLALVRASRLCRSAKVSLPQSSASWVFCLLYGLTVAWLQAVYSWIQESAARRDRRSIKFTLRIHEAMPSAWLHAFPLPLTHINLP